MADQVPHDDLVAAATPASRTVTVIGEAFAADDTDINVPSLLALALYFIHGCRQLDLEPTALLEQIEDAVDQRLFNGQLPDEDTRQRAALLVADVRLSVRN